MFYLRRKFLNLIFLFTYKVFQQKCFILCIKFMNENILSRKFMNINFIKVQSFWLFTYDFKYMVYNLSLIKFEKISFRILH